MRAVSEGRTLDLRDSLVHHFRSYDPFVDVHNIMMQIGRCLSCGIGFF
jgi:hypothetical protein